jgi:hypothetical protein
MSKLTLEDLSFFDSHKPTGGESVQHNRPGSLADLSSLYGGQPQVLGQPKAESKDQEEDDDFGDFVESHEEQKVLAPQPFVPTEKKEPSRPVSNANHNGVSVQSRIDDLSAFPQQQIKFGQHLVNKKGADGSIGPRPSHTTAKQWGELLSSTPEPKQFVEKDEKTRKPKTVVTSKPSVAVDFFDQPWDSFGPDDDNLVDVEEGSEKMNSGVNLPSSETLLIYMHENILPFIETALLKKLAPLAYQIRKRVLAHPKTKEFITGYVELLQVANRIMVGRHRRAQTVSKADREARQVERIWQALFARVKAIVQNPNTLPQLSAKVVYPVDNASSQKCPVCGLYSTEFIKGLSKPAWAETGHKSCLAFWDHRNLFGI